MVYGSYCHWAISPIWHSVFNSLELEYRSLMQTIHQVLYFLIQSIFSWFNKNISKIKTYSVLTKKWSINSQFIYKFKKKRTHWSEWFCVWTVHGSLPELCLPWWMESRTWTSWCCCSSRTLWSSSGVPSPRSKVWRVLPGCRQTSGPAHQGLPVRQKAAIQYLCTSLTIFHWTAKNIYIFV